jgi:hypothetical protein
MCAAAVVLTQLMACATPDTAAPSQKFTPAAISGAETGMLYVYRPSRAQVLAMSPAIVVDGKEIVTLNDNTYVAIPLPAGDHRVDLKLGPGFMGSALTTVNIDKGESSFVRVGAESVIDKAAQRFDRTFRIMTVDAKTGTDEIKECRPASPAQAGAK